ncbi:MAG TPA: TlpA disulfide reductase family protein [Haliangiales bacterium]|nr:TlpA disulfide reductase family protein [Haliangiales bacterium]
MRAAAVCLVILALGASPAGATKPGDRAHDFSLPSIDGKSVTLSDLKGAVIIVDFWASWCGPCKKELPALDRLAAKYAGKVVVLAVNIDKERKKADAFLSQAKVSRATVLLDPAGKVAAAYDVPTMPSSYVVDGHGIIKHVQAGYKSGDEETIEDKIRELMK